MKSTLNLLVCFAIILKIVQIVENPSDAQKYLQIHTHAVHIAMHLFFKFFTKQVSATYAQQIYLHWTEQKYAHKKTVN